MIKKKHIVSLLFHMFVVWTVLHLGSLIPYLYRVHLYGDYLWQADGTATTGWEYFTLMYYGSDLWHLFVCVVLFVPLAELSYWHVARKKNFPALILSSFAIGAIIMMFSLFPAIADGSAQNFLFYIQSCLYFMGYALVYSICRKYITELVNKKDIELQRSETELNALKAQLNPHFFFNSINYVYGTALSENAPKTAEATSMLSELMRYIISGIKEKYVPLPEELDFIKNYLALQKLRLPVKDSIDIVTSITFDDQDQRIAPLLLLPFIENAFKYGTSIDHPCSIRIRINASGNKLEMLVTNTLIQSHAEIRGTNTGIVNVKKRLDLLYRDGHSLKTDDTGTEYRVNLTLKLN